MTMYPAPPAAPAPAPAKKKHRLFRILGVLTGLLLVIGIVSAIASPAPSKKAALPSAPKASASVTAPAADDSTPTPVADTTRDPVAKDFTVRFKVKTKQCFGSAGCVYTGAVRIGWDDNLFTGDYDVTYEILGVEGGPQVGTLTVHEDGTFDYTDEDFETTHNVKVFKVKITDVEKDL